MAPHPLSMTTDYASVSTGCPEPYLRRIAEAGFSGVHWCHQWNTDFVYADCEIDSISLWMRELGLSLTDLHASSGEEKNWCSPREYERLAGVELVKNRLDMTARLGSDAIIMHIPIEPADPAENRAYWTLLRASLDALEGPARSRGVRIAIENLGKDNFDTLERLFGLYAPSYLGLCYDSGHGNVAGTGLGRLDRVKGRLISVHLHDNDGSGDQHKLPFDGTIDWPRLARILAESSYRKPVSMESNTRSYPEGVGEMAYLRKAFDAGTRLTEMIAAYGPNSTINSGGVLDSREL